MKWIRFTLETHTDAVDILSYMLDEIGVEGIEIEDHIPLTKEEKRQMYVDILPDPEENDGSAKVHFYMEPENCNPDTVITRAHFARVLVDKGYAPNMGKAFDKYLQYGGKYCMRKEVVTPEQAMKLLTSSGAWPCLAHPMQYHLGYDQIRVLVGSLKEQGLRGLEVYHSSQNPYQSSKLREIAREFGLLPSGGSDFHGSNKPDIDIGVGRGGLRISYALLKDIKEDYYGRTVSND